MKTTRDFIRLLAGAFFILALAACSRKKSIPQTNGIVLVGLTWAEGNLIYTGTYPDGTYFFASTQEYYTGTWNGGDYWGWCQLDPTVLTSYTGSYSVSVDPCQMVAPTGTWRMPTLTEFTNLINAGSVWTSKNGVNGMYFGTSSVPAAGTESNYVFLPAAGRRNDGSTTMDHVGTDGYYWSATPNGRPYAYSLNGGGTLAGTYPGRYDSFMVRCVSGIR